MVLNTRCGFQTFQFYQTFFLLICLGIMISSVSSQNCTRNQFLKDGSCKDCGSNSETNNEGPCQCYSNFGRKNGDLNDYTKDCYRLPSKPRNVTVDRVNSTEIVYRWQAPAVNDRHLTTKYEVRFLICDDKQECKISGSRIRQEKREYVATGLTPFTKYHIIVCAFNDATALNKETCVDVDHIDAVITKKGKPGLIENFQINFLSQSDIYYVSFGAPSHMGSKEISVVFTCDDSAKTTFRRNVTKLKENKQITVSVQKICAKTVRCSIHAENSFGKGPTKSKFFQLNDDCKSKDGSNDTVGIVVAIIVIIVVIVALAFAYLWWWKRKQAKIERRWMLQLERANNLSNTMMQPFRPRNLYVDAMGVEQFIARSFEGGELEEETTYFTDDSFDFEYPRDNLNILHKLGEGNFAYVYKAEAIDIAGHQGVSQVAVKVLKDSADEKDQNDFMDELELMKDIKPNKNVVRLLGCCTTKGQIAMIVEFLPAGDLLDYLRKSRKYAGLKGVCSNLTEKDFLQFAYDIASGMAHLASHNIVHRDLACRNVLVGSSRICKIADMGLARTIGDSGFYMREKEAKLPIKWMAPESLFYGRSTIKSDVWSFGIVFWEIVTLGASPYPGYKSRDIVQLLRKRYRMEKPEHCSDDIFEIMNDCWNEAYDLRPTFSSLKERLKPLTDTEENYMNFDTFQEDLYISFDDDDDDMNLEQINSNEDPNADYDRFANANKTFEVDLKNKEAVSYKKHIEP